MSPAGKILEAIRLGLGPVGDADPAAHLRMYLRDAGIDAGAKISAPSLFDDDEEGAVVRVDSVLCCAGSPLVALHAWDEAGGEVGVELTREGATVLAAHLILALFDAEELARRPGRPKGGAG